ncbi:MAG: M28 family peptidase [Gemmatimonadetes bacterium]|nr:M28 family peptidase [Gemmatimonadota bacterium]
MSRRTVLVLTTAVLLAGCASPPADRPGGTDSPDQAEASATLAAAAAVITAEDSRDYLAVLAHDSMMGRDSRRPEIWAAARYIAAQFAAMGLEPLDQDGDFIAEYPIDIPETDIAQVRMVVEGHGERLELQCGQDFAIMPSVQVPSFTGVVVAPLVKHDWYRNNPGSIPNGSLVLAYGPTGSGGIAEGLRFMSWMENVEEAGANAVGMILPPGTPLEVIPALAQQMAGNPRLDGPPMLMLPSATVEKIFALSGSAAPELDPLEAIQRAPVTVTLQMPVTIRTITAPNVVARLPGSGQADLADVVLTAHFDHEPPGVPTAEGDSIYNGADDNASGTVGLLEVARAFSALQQQHPTRSVVFAAVSAEEMGLLGSARLAEEGPAPATTTAADLNMDMLSRNGPDSLFVFGQTYSSLGAVFRDVLKSHPELGLEVRPGLQMPDLDLIRFSDQAPYMARGVPVLFFNSGFHPELHTPDDELELANTDKIARAARLMFFLAYAVADNPVDPVWTDAGRTRTEAMQRALQR